MPLVAVFSIPGLLMVVVGAAGIYYGLRSLRPQVRDVEEFLRARDRSPGPWSNFLASGGTVFALFSLLIGIMLLIFGIGLLILTIGEPG